MPSKSSCASKLCTHNFPVIAFCALTFQNKSKKCYRYNISEILEDFPLTRCIRDQRRLRCVSSKDFFIHLSNKKPLIKFLALSVLIIKCILPHTIVIHSIHPNLHFLIQCQPHIFRWIINRQYI